MSMGGTRGGSRDGGPDPYTESSPSDGSSSIQGGDGDDSLTGGSGDDTIHAGRGSNTVHGGDGNDVIDDESGVIYYGPNEFHGEGGHDTIWSGDGNDTVTGDGGNDLLYGEGGSDQIEGGDGSDTIYGGAGDDTLIGGSGADYLSGGDGHDTFSLKDASSYDLHGADTISDFDMGDDDHDGFTNDRLDVSHLRDENGEAVETWDVSVGDDGCGNAFLMFPNGEKIVLAGISPSSVSSPGQLYAMGIPCFVKGTLIETPGGAVPVERLQAGDRVMCADGSVLPILWAGGRVLDEEELQERPQLRPIEIRHGSLGNRRDLRLSPQHAVALQTPEGIKLARATHLAQRGTGRFRVARGVKSVSYHHLLLPRHSLLLAEGAVVESMWPGPIAMAAIGIENRDDILRRAPHLKSALDGDVPVERLYGPRTAPMLRGREVKTMARIETPAAQALVAVA